MTPAQFEQQCRAIADCSVQARLPTAWAWVTGVDNAGYLVYSFENAYLGPLDPASSGDDDAYDYGGESVDAAAELEDTGTLVRDTGTEAAAIRTELHVALSPVYSQPQLLFNLRSASTGVPLAHADVCALVERWVKQQPDPGAPSAADATTTNVPQTSAVTQQEHPVLGTPFYALHGCETAGLMRAMGHSEDDAGYVFGWLSLVAPLVRLKLPIELAAAVMEAG